MSNTKTMKSKPIIISEERQALIIRILSWSQRHGKKSTELTRKDMIEALNSRT
jgi:hypothetical protein